MSRETDRLNLISRIGSAVSDYLASRESEYKARAVLIAEILEVFDLCATPTTGDPNE